MIEISCWQKYMLTLRETAAYFPIGDKKMCQIVEDHIDAKYLLENGNKIMIKRKLVEAYLDKVTVIRFSTIGIR